MLEALLVEPSLELGSMRVNVDRIVLNHHKNLKFAFSLSYTPFTLYVIIFYYICYTFTYSCHLHHLMYISKE